MVPAVCVRIGPYGRTQQRNAQHVVLVVISVLGVVDQTEAMLRVAKVGPAQSRYFKLRLLPGVIARCCAFNASVGNFICGFVAGCGQWECSLQQDMSLVPIEVIYNVYLIGTGIKCNVLYKL